MRQLSSIKLSFIVLATRTSNRRVVECMHGTVEEYPMIVIQKAIYSFFDANDDRRYQEPVINAVAGV